MKLRFLAVADAHVREHGVNRYYGYSYSAEAKGQVISKDPFTVDADSEDGRKCVKAARKGDLLVADQATADAIGVAFKGAKAPKKEAS